MNPAIPSNNLYRKGHARFAASGPARAGSSVGPQAREVSVSRSPAIAAFACLVVAAVACERPPDAEGPPPTPEERLADWATLPEGTPVPVALGFGRTLPDSAVAELLDRHDLRPYVVYLSAAGTRGEHWRDRSRASLEVLAEAREQTFAQLRTSLCAQRGRARAMLSAGDAGADPLYREVLARFVTLQKTLPEIERGAPLVFGVEAVGGIAGARAVGRDPAVASYEPGWRGEIGGVDTAIVPQPPAPPEEPLPAHAEIAALTPEEVRARMERLAEDGMGMCADASAP